MGSLAPSRGPTLGGVVGGVVALAGFVLGARALRDNSFLTHLATGRFILDEGSVPSTDPYTFTASGEPWVVQSWLVSVLYAGAEEVGGPAGIRLVVGLLFCGLVVALWALSRPAAALVVRLVIVVLAVGVGGELWTERPLVLGLGLLALTLLIVERSWSPVLLVPVGWVWVNSHGSFPLGGVALLLVVLGGRLDRGTWSGELRYLGFFALGVVSGAIGPLGVGALLFPLDLVTGNEILDSVAEWRAPTFTTLSQRLFLVQLVAAVALLVRRPTWRAGLPMVVFSVAALVSLRNIAVASVVLVPGMTSAAPVVGSLRAAASVSRPRVLTVVLALVIAGAGFARLQQPSYRLDGRYPLQALAWMESTGIGPRDVRVATSDPVGNLVDLLYGPHQQTFFDDRFDMFPAEVSRRFLYLRDGSPGWRTVLDEHEIEVVVWRRELSLGQLLVSDDEWSVRYTDDRWVVAVRNDV